MKTEMNLVEQTGNVAKWKIEVAQLESAYERSIADVASAAAALAAHDGLEKEISRFRVQALKSKSDPRTLPDGLKAKQAAKKECAAELEAAEATREAIREELDSAKTWLRNESAKQLPLAMAALTARVDESARALIELNDKRYRLLFEIEAFATMQFEIAGERHPAPGYTPTMAEAVVNGRATVIDGLTIGDVQERYLAALIRIMSDPTAEIGWIL